MAAGCDAAKRPEKRPVVLTREEVQRVLHGMTGLISLAHQAVQASLSDAIPGRITMLDPLILQVTLIDSVQPIGILTSVKVRSCDA